MNLWIHRMPHQYNINVSASASPVDRYWRCNNVSLDWIEENWIMIFQHQRIDCCGAWRVVLVNITCKSPKIGERAKIDEFYASTESMRGTNFSGFYHWFLFPVEQLARGTISGCVSYLKERDQKLDPRQGFSGKSELVTILQRSSY